MGSIGSVIGIAAKHGSAMNVVAGKQQSKHDLISKPLSISAKKQPGSGV